MPSNLPILNKFIISRRNLQVLKTFEPTLDLDHTHIPPSIGWKLECIFGVEDIITHLSQVKENNRHRVAPVSVEANRLQRKVQKSTKICYLPSSASLNLKASSRISNIFNTLTWFATDLSLSRCQEFHSFYPVSKSWRRIQSLDF